MRIAKRELRVSWLLAMVLLISMAGFAQEFPPSADLTVSKFAPAEVGAGSAFAYIIAVVNLDAANNATDVVVTDKLPFEIHQVSAADITAPEASSISVTGDLVTILYDEIPADTIYTIAINATAPSDAPTTLYNTAIVRYDGDPDATNNTATTTTYVLEAGYGKVAAVESFEDLLHRQSSLLFSFQDLLNQVPNGTEENYTFITSCEQLLRAQANLTSCFEGILFNETGSGWDNNFTSANRTELLSSYETMLRDEAYLFAGFHAKIENSWTSLGNNFTAEGHTLDAQTEFIASFEDLLKRQTRLYHGFEHLFKKIDVNAEPQTHESLVGFLASFEDLLRVESNLLMGFQDLLEKKFKGQPSPGEFLLSLTVQSQWILNDDYKIYNFTVNNTGNADALGVVLTSKYDLFLADNASLNTTPPTLYPASQAGWVDNLNGTASYTFAVIPAGTSALATLEIHVPGTDGNGTLVNTAILYPGEIQVQDLNNRTVLTMPAPQIRKSPVQKVRDVLMRM